MPNNQSPISHVHPHTLTHTETCLPRGSALPSLAASISRPLHYNRKDRTRKEKVRKKWATIHITSPKKKKAHGTRLVSVCQCKADHSPATSALVFRSRKYGGIEPRGTFIGLVFPTARNLFYANEEEGNQKKKKSWASLFVAFEPQPKENPGFPNFWLSTILCRVDAMQ
jgi:hypothetical protein